MHELSLCESILQILEDQASAQQYDRVKTVCLEIGALAGVELDALRFGFEVVTRDTLADGATLKIARVPGKAWCLQCTRTVTVNARFDPCPQCGGYQMQISGGDDLRIKELEVD